MITPRIALPLLLACLLALAGCTLSPHSSDNYQRLTAAASQAPEQAWLNGEQLVLQTRINDKPVLLQATLSAPGGDYRFIDAVIEGGERLPRHNDDGSEPVLVAPQDSWTRLLSAVVEGLLPADSNGAIALFIGTQEKVLWRDSRGDLQLANYSDRPEQLDIVRRYDSEAFSRAIFDYLADYVRTHHLSARRALFINTSGRRNEAAFLYVDLERHLSATLHRPWQADLEQVGTENLRDRLGHFDSLLIRSHVVTLVKNPFTWFWRLGVFSVNSVRVVFERPTPFGSADVVPLHDGPGMDLVAWEKDLNRVLLPDSYRGSIEFLIDGDAYFPRLLDAIRSADEQVLMRTYIFDNDDYAVTVADTLRERGLRDGDVRVLFDDLGSRMAWQTWPQSPMPDDFSAPANMATYLARDKAVSVRATPNPWLTGDHVKSTVVDDRAFVGGMNIGREYRSEWHDLMMEVSGPVVTRLERDFHRANAHAGPFGDFGFAAVGLFYPVRDFFDAEADAAHYIDIRPLYTRTGNAQIHRAQLRAIRRAKRYIYVQNSYFSDNLIQQELIRARRRGVDVRVILPSHGNHGVMNANNAVVTNRFLENGIRVYRYPGMSHIKAAIIDGWACLGSANFDKLSFRVNQELNLAFSDPHTVNVLKTRVFEHDFNLSEEITEPVRISLGDRLATALANQL